ncbi:circularly permuted type 2 ATP-grasp protein [Amorphus orientalis]|nr:circularly permuted type 2 ATP-grasp protein [Amorphus orientalis]
MVDAPFDEMTSAGNGCRPAYNLVKAWLDTLDPEILKQRSHEAELLFRRIGITFAVYGQAEAEERIIPFDVVPRVLTIGEWQRLSEGLTQRVRALNAFLADIYGQAEILKAGIVPSDLVYQNPYFRPEMIGLKVPRSIYVPISGIDIVRVDSETFYVLEDNARTPSGVSYMLENREVMMRLFPDLFSEHRIAPVENYPDELLQTLRSLAPPTTRGEPTVVLLSPGQFNSAYYEHTFLADRLGIELVEGRDLFVRDNTVFMRTTQGPKRVDVIYRRLDDEFLDPLAFRPDSVLGVPGLMAAYRAGNVTLANAVGTGVADDKAIYTYMPEIVRFYLGQEPILKNVPTWRCREPDHLAYVLDHLEELVVKEVSGSGGYGMLVGPKADKEQIETFREKLKAKPDDFIAQPTLALSTCPTFVGEGIAPRHVDLRPFVLSGADQVRIVPGGLTRVALREGSLVVNSSQGGGTKDTWVLDDPTGADAPPGTPSGPAEVSSVQSQTQTGPSGQSQSQSQGQS